MRVLTGLSTLRRPPRRAVVTVGVFDGVHVGHQQLIRSTIRLAHRVRGTSVVITFDPDPQVVLHPGTSAPALMPLNARLSALKTL
ncbi:MAG: adenylyltransferase/cytidyltransferase family protein, partial [Candidatus Omnitrophota bacterium]|nr:adenylyltransferase/cytidyltransferase family protein [Candidatus Omnitrophota bacterium]